VIAINDERNKIMINRSLHEWAKFLGMKIEPRKKDTVLEAILNALPDWSFGEGIHRQSAMMGAAVAIIQMKEDLEVICSTSDRGLYFSVSPLEDWNSHEIPAEDVFINWMKSPEEFAEGSHGKLELELHIDDLGEKIRGLNEIVQKIEARITESKRVLETIKVKQEQEQERMATVMAEGIALLKAKQGK
jgi:hypothetical protein